MDTILGIPRAHWDAMIEEVRSHVETYNERYYKVLLGRGNQPVVIELWGYEEFDYDEDRWLSDERFDTAQAAREWFLGNAELQREVRARQEWPGLY